MFRSIFGPSADSKCLLASGQNDPLVSPALLRAEIPLSLQSKATIARARVQIADILSGNSDKVLVLVGPCSLHSPEEAKEYAALLRKEAEGLQNLVVVMRAYFEKVRRRSQRGCTDRNRFKCSARNRIRHRWVNKGS